MSRGITVFNLHDNSNFHKKAQGNEMKLIQMKINYGKFLCARFSELQNC